MPKVLPKRTSTPPRQWAPKKRNRSGSRCRSLGDNTERPSPLSRRRPCSCGNRAPSGSCTVHRRRRTTRCHCRNHPYTHRSPSLDIRNCRWRNRGRSRDSRSCRRSTDRVTTCCSPACCPATRHCRPSPGRAWAGCPVAAASHFCRESLCHSSGARATHRAKRPPTADSGAPDTGSMHRELPPSWRIDPASMERTSTCYRRKSSDTYSHSRPAETVARRRVRPAR